MMMHGYAEHLRWYHDLGVQFADQGLLAFGHDHSKRPIKKLIFLFNWDFLSSVGHGQSGGDRVIVENVEYMVQDAVTHIKVMQGHYPGVPTFLVGHSMVYLVI